MNKSEQVLTLFYEEPSKHWHFSDLVSKAGISKPQAAFWLKKFMREGIITREKIPGKMPYYRAEFKHSAYQLKKRLFALQTLEQSLFLKHLMDLPGADTIILFGSMSRWDWHSASDIDIFIYGNPEGLNIPIYRRILHKPIDTFIFNSREDLNKIPRSLLKNIQKGYRIKGTLDLLEAPHA